MEREKTQTKKQQRPRPNLRGVLSFQPKMCYFQYPEAICPSSRSFPETEGKPPEKKRKKVKQKNRRKKNAGTWRVQQGSGRWRVWLTTSAPLSAGPSGSRCKRHSNQCFTFLSCLAFCCLFFLGGLRLASPHIRANSTSLRPNSPFFFFCFFPCLFIRNKKGGRHADSRRR